MNDKLLQLLKKQAENQISLSEQIELSDLLSDPNNKDSFQLMQDEWKTQVVTETEPLQNYKALLGEIHHRIRLNENKAGAQIGWLQTFQRIAAILIVPLILTFVAYFYFQPEKPNQNNSYAEIICPLGVRTKFLLPDGSTGYLNSGSKLKYQVVFTNERKVELVGEAFFDVTHNEKIPFHVNTKNLDIKVLGTKFNVIANNDEQTEKVVLESGKVDVSSASGKQLAVLMPNEQITLNTEKQTFSKKTVEVSQYTSWKEGKLVFRDENMQQVAKRLSRWYNVEVVVNDSLLENYSFHATFVDEPLDEVLKLLSLTSPLSYHEEKRTSNANGVFDRRKVRLQTDRTKINQFK